MLSSSSLFVVNCSGFVGVATAFGEVRINPASGAFLLLDDANNVLTRSDAFSSFSSQVGGRDAHNDTCVQISNADAVGGSRSTFANARVVTMCLHDRPTPMKMSET